MTSRDDISIREIGHSRYGELKVLELPKGMPLPPVHSELTVQGQTFGVVGILDLGDGHGPHLLALKRDSGR